MSGESSEFAVFKIEKNGNESIKNKKKEIKSMFTTKEKLE